MVGTLIHLARDRRLRIPAKKATPPDGDKVARLATVRMAQCSRT